MDTSSSSRGSLSPQDLALNRAFLDFDMDNLEESDARMSLALAGLFPASYNEFELAIYIKDDDYNFSIDTEIIKMVEDNKFYGKDEDFSYEHVAGLEDISQLFGKNEIQQHYYFLKLFPFSLGGDAKKWYNSLAPRSITSMDGCMKAFWNKYFPVSVMFARKAEMSKFAQNKKVSLPDRKSVV